ncbi:hypothetical protein HY251_00155 [bacterium]|nr:hypothetical protein [bacterium]
MKCPRKSFALPVAALAVALLAPLAPARAEDAEKIDQARAKASLKRAEKIEKEVEALRELKYQVPVRKGVASKTELRKFISEEIAKPETKTDIAKEEKVGKAFGFLPRDFDLAKESADMLLAGIAVYYDPDKKRFFLIVHEKGWLGLPEEQADEQDGFTMSHELEHALQDQNFDLQRWSLVLEHNADRASAWKFVYEGEANYVAYRWQAAQKGERLGDLQAKVDTERAMVDRIKPMLKDKSVRDMLPKEVIEQTELMDRLPPYLVQNIMLPYEDGAIFVQRVFDKGGWAAVTKLFSDPPSSTQQVLHPDKFFDRQEPVEISLPSLTKLAGSKAQEIDGSTLGELNVRILLETLGTKKKRAARVAAGWHGDRFEAVEIGSSVVLVWLTIWEDETKAKLFEDTYRPGLEKLHKGTTGFSLARHGSEVLLVDCEDAALRSRLEAKGWASVVAESHLRPLPEFVERPPVKDFTEEKEATPPAEGDVALGARVNDEELGFSVRLPQTYKKQAKDVLPAEFQQFSRGYWKTDGDADLRVLDVPMPFDKENLLQQFEALVRKGVKDFKKISDSSRSVGGHESIEIRFEGILPDGTNAKRELKAVAVERDDMTLLLLASAPAGRLEAELNAIEASLATLEIVPSKLKDELVVRSEDKGASFSVGPAWKEAAAKSPVILRAETKDGASIQLVTMKAGKDDIDADAKTFEGMRSGKLDSYRSLGVSRIERDELGRGYICDYEYKAQDGAAKRVRELVVLRSGKRYALTCACAPDAFEKNRPVFTRALATFSLGKPEKRETKPETRPEKKPVEPKPEKKPAADEPF